MFGWASLQGFLAYHQTIPQQRLCQLSKHLPSRRRECIVIDPVPACNIFNDHFSNIANDIGRDLSEEEVQNHTRVTEIREHVPTGAVPFVFKTIIRKDMWILLVSS